MKIPSISAEKIRRNALLTREMRREAWAMPALVFGAGIAFCSFGILVQAVRHGHVGPWGVYALYGVVAVFGTLIGWSCLRGSGRMAGEGYEPPPPRRTEIISTVKPANGGFGPSGGPAASRGRTMGGRLAGSSSATGSAADVSVSIGLTEAEPCRVIVRSDRLNGA